MSDSYQFYYNNDTHHASYQILASAVAARSNFAVTPIFNEFKCDVYVLLDDPTSNVIAVDWDNTFTAHPRFYNKLIRSYLEAGFKPIICTLRGDQEEDVHDICELMDTGSVEICPTDGKYKRSYIKQKNGVSVNLWIDDFFPGISDCSCELMLNNGVYI